MNKLIFALIGVVLLFACGENEDELTPSNVDRNWLVLEDNPDDEVDHQLFLLFEKYGLPIYYNDTIGSMERTDVFGNTYTHYELLKVFYSASTYPGGNYTLFPKEKKTELLPVLEVLDEVVLPRLTREMGITSLFLVDSLTVSSTGIGMGDSTIQYRGFNTWALGWMDDFEYLTEEERTQWGVDLLIDLVSDQADFDPFFAVSDDFGAKYSETSTSINFYSMGGQNALLYGYPASINLAEIYAGIRLETDTWPPEKITDLDYLNMPEDLCLETYGILAPLRGDDIPEPSPDGPKYLWLIPTDDQDLQDYCNAVFEYTPTAFEEKYGAYPVVMEKYNIIKGIFESFGFEFE